MNNCNRQNHNFWFYMSFCDDSWFQQSKKKQKWEIACFELNSIVCNLFFRKYFYPYFYRLLMHFDNGSLVKKNLGKVALNLSFFFGKYIKFCHNRPISLDCFKHKGLGAIRAKFGPTSDVDNIFSKMYSQYALFRNKYS